MRGSAGTIISQGLLQWDDGYLEAMIECPGEENQVTSNEMDDSSG
jgi:hypothetical protein